MLVGEVEVCRLSVWFAQCSSSLSTSNRAENSVLLPQFFLIQISPKHRRRIKGLPFVSL